ncbi:la-related protein 1B-like [Momordica charantia]|uniref:La-related protein 1B-like n=1 Tax=Momordica charantia TaxID=3673 RepID=A0A6J1CWB8_MOMCH|nr:la-related protein 1B-like [Momordica charantia]
MARGSSSNGSDDYEIKEKIRNGGFEHYHIDNQIWYSHSNGYGWEFCTPIDPPPYSGYVLSNPQNPMAYYISPNFGPSNYMYNSCSPSPPPPPSPPIYHPFPTKELYWKIINQVNYYFSDENLRHDTFLKKHMDVDGWVPIQLIATFNRMRILTNDIEYILFALHGSSVVEVQDDKVRRKK